MTSFSSKYKEKKTMKRRKLNSTLHFVFTLLHSFHIILHLFIRSVAVALTDSEANSVELMLFVVYLVRTVVRVESRFCLFVFDIISLISGTATI